MATEWTEERLQRYIDDQTQEDLNLDYKGAGALSKSDDKKKEIHKDVSAMANSAGGVLIYGIREYDDAARRHLPERFDPVDQSVFTREWLEQVISGIQPRIQNLVITPVAIGSNPNDAIFIVEIPASSTAHQSSDHRYYKRRNFESSPMEDYEVRDVMNRSSYALIDLKFELEWQFWTITEEKPELTPSYSGTQKSTRRKRNIVIKVFAENLGAVYAQYVVGYLYIPRVLVANPNDYESIENDFVKIRIDNSREISQGMRIVQTHDLPILPGAREEIAEIELSTSSMGKLDSDISMRWEVLADNARRRQANIPINDFLTLQRKVHIYATEQLGYTYIEDKKIEVQNS